MFCVNVFCSLFEIMVLLLYLMIMIWLWNFLSYGSDLMSVVVFCVVMFGVVFWMLVMRCRCCFCVCSCG